MSAQSAIRSYSKYALKTAAFQEDKRRDSRKELDGLQEDPKEVDEIFSTPCQKLLQAQKRSNYSGRNREIDRIKRAFAGTNHCERETDSDTRQHKDKREEPRKFAHVRVKGVEGTKVC